MLVNKGLKMIVVIVDGPFLAEPLVEILNEKWEILNGKTVLLQQITYIHLSIFYIYTCPYTIVTIITSSCPSSAWVVLGRHVHLFYAVDNWNNGKRRTCSQDTENRTLSSYGLISHGSLRTWVPRTILDKTDTWVSRPVCPSKVFLRR